MFFLTEQVLQEIITPVVQELERHEQFHKTSRKVVSDVTLTC